MKPIYPIESVPQLNTLSQQCFNIDSDQYCFCKDDIKNKLKDENDEKLEKSTYSLTSEKEDDIQEINDHSDKLDQCMIQIRTSEKNLNYLEMLSEYDFVSEFRVNAKNGKRYLVYICKHKECGKEFLRTWNLLDHARMHCGIKPFECEFCCKKFTQKCNLKKHLQKHNNPSIESRRKYQCKICESKFTERYNYKTHLMRSHGLKNINSRSL